MTENLIGFCEPKLEFYKNHIYADNIGSKTMYNIIFEGEERCAQQYLKLLVRLLSCVELEFKKEKTSSVGCLRTLFRLAAYDLREPLFEESKGMGINVDEVISYVLNRTTKADFQYPLFFTFGEKVSSWIVPACDPKDGVTSYSYKMKPDDGKTYVQGIRKLETDDLSTDKSFRDLVLNKE